MANLDELLLRMLKNSASDLHIVVGARPKYRIHGDILPVADYPVLDEATVHEWLWELIDDKQRERYTQHLDFDFAYGIGEQARYRCNYFFQRTGFGAVFRIIPFNIATIAELHLPSVLNSLAFLRGGLVLVTGPTGSGKSTTLAAIINLINQTQRRHIVTIEDPIEFVHKK